MGRATLRNVALAASWSCVAACSDDTRKPVQWQDVFHVVDSVTLASDVLGQLLGERDAGADLGAGWRAPFPGSAKMLRGPRQGERAAQLLVGLPREVGDVPYWPSWHRSVGAIGDATVFGASNFVYTIRQYTWEGTVLDSIAEAPSSWRPARLLPRGAFSDQNHDEMREYLKGATFIVGMAAVRGQPDRRRGDGRTFASLRSRSARPDGRNPVRQRVRSWRAGGGGRRRPRRDRRVRTWRGRVRQAKG